MINVDKIVTISLKDREDRRSLVLHEVAKLNLKTQFFLAEPDSQNRERGCFLSHVAVSQAALREQCDNVLIFEDDVRILSYTNKQIDAINHFLGKNKHFDILYLGLIIGEMWFTGMPSIVGAKGAGAHAYILSKRGMQKLANYQFSGIPIDRIMKRDFNCYSVYPIIAEQYPETIVSSDITHARINGKIKNHEYWENNYRKQQWLPWKNLHKAVIEWINRTTTA